MSTSWSDLADEDDDTPIPIPWATDSSMLKLISHYFFF